jgi:probable phosphoglycerate mutase
VSTTEFDAGAADGPGVEPTVQEAAPAAPTGARRRHSCCCGTTPLTPQERFSGSGGSDPSLPEAGRRQAAATAALLAARRSVQAIVASPLRRSRQTAEAVAARLGLDVHVDHGLREADFGAWEGMTFASVRERYARRDPPEGPPSSRGGGTDRGRWRAVEDRRAAAR